MSSLLGCGFTNVPDPGAMSGETTDPGGGVFDDDRLIETSGSDAFIIDQSGRGGDQDLGVDSDSQVASDCHDDVLGDASVSDATSDTDIIPNETDVSPPDDGDDLTPPCTEENELE